MVEKNYTEVERHINDLRFKRITDAHHDECSITRRISCNVDKVSHFLKMKNISEKVNEDFSKTTAKSLDTMFLALTEPMPSYFEILYNKTIYGPQSRLIMLASNIVNKSPENFKLQAKKIYSKIASIVFKKYHNESLENSKYISIVKGKIH